MAFCAQCKAPTASANFCTNCGAALSLGRTSGTRPWIYLAMAFAWSAVAVGVCLGYHLPESSGVLSVTTNGHTYTGHPPALTLFQRDPVSFATIAIVLSAGLAVATIDLVVRAVQHTNRVSGGAVAAGAMIILFSFFGLLLGVASLGVVGLLLIFSGLPIKQKSAKRPSEQYPIP